MPAPTLWAQIRHVIGRAFRETGQALDRVGIRGIEHTTTSKTLGDPCYKFNDHLSRHRTFMPLLKRGSPSIHENVAFIAPCATLIGNVHVSEHASVWYGAVLRGDACNYGYGHSEETYKKWREYTKEERLKHDMQLGGKPAGGAIYVGAGTNVQDGCIITAREDHAKLGEGVTVGHMAQIHSATVESNSLIGMGALINPGAKVESQSFVAAGAIVGRDEVVKSGELWVGNPARKLRDLTVKEREKLFYQADQVSFIFTVCIFFLVGGKCMQNLIGLGITIWTQYLSPEIARTSLKILVPLLEVDAVLGH